MVKYVQLVKKFQKEDKDEVTVATKNAPVLYQYLKGKLETLTGKETELKQELLEAKDSVERAEAMLTNNVEEWLAHVDMAEATEESIAQDLEQIQFNMEYITKKMQLFE